MCVFVAALIHYFYLAGFGWMLFEGIYLYLMVVKVFNTVVSMRLFYAFAWGKYAFFSRIGTQIWNSIPYSIKLLKRSSFRQKIKELLLNFLRSEDDYVEVSRLIKLFNTLG